MCAVPADAIPADEQIKSPCEVQFQSLKVCECLEINGLVYPKEDFAAMCLGCFSFRLHFKPQSLNTSGSLSSKDM